jgi:hypothetical protein
MGATQQGKRGFRGTWTIIAGSVVHVVGQGTKRGDLDSDDEAITDYRSAS